MCVCSQTSLGLSGQVQLVQRGGYQMGSLHYTDSIGGAEHQFITVYESSPRAYMLFFFSCKIQLSCGAERQR